MCEACRNSEGRGYSKSYTLQNIRKSRGNWFYCQECKKREDLSSVGKHSCYEAPTKKSKLNPVKKIEKCEWCPEESVSEGMCKDCCLRTIRNERTMIKSCMWCKRQTTFGDIPLCYLCSEFYQENLTREIAFNCLTKSRGEWYKCEKCPFRAQTTEKDVEHDCI